MAIIKFINNKVSLKTTLNYICKEEKTEYKLVSGKDCVVENAYEEMRTVKNIFNKTDGREKIHFVQAFSPEDNITPEKAHKIGMEIAEYFKDFQVVVATHIDKKHIHNHFAINTVSYKNGKKFHQSKKELQEIKDISNEICRKYGLKINAEKSRVVDIKINEYKTRIKGTSWKMQLEKDIEESMNKSKNKYDFFKKMNLLGYKVNWNKENKYIVYTVPVGYKCSDRKLHNEKYLKENMEKYFEEKKNVIVKGYKKQERHIRYRSVSLTLAELIESLKRTKDNNIQNDITFNTNASAKKQYAMEMHYSLEELEDMEF